MHRSTRRGGGTLAALEHLEPRALMSAPYGVAGVGLRFDADGARVIEFTGTLGSDESFVGTQVTAGVTGAPVSGGLDWATLQLLSGGRMRSTPGNGLDPYDAQVGGVFAPDRGYQWGSLSGSRHSGAELDTLFMLERAVGRTIDWSSISFDFQYLEIGAGGYSLTQGMFSVNAEGEMQWSTSPDGSGAVPVDIVSQDGSGSLVLSNGRRLHVSPGISPRTYSPLDYWPGVQLMIVDTDNNDGTVGIGIGRAQWQGGQLYYEEGLQGVYRASVLTTGTVGAQFFGASPVPGGGLAAASVALEFANNGQYRVYDLGAYDAGERTVISEGYWGVVPSPGVRNSIISLATGSQLGTARFLVTPDRDLVAESVTDGGTTQLLIGVASAFSTVAIDLTQRGGHVGLDQQGHPIFYESVTVNLAQESESQEWRSLDLVEAFGGKALVSVESRLSAFTANRHMVIGVATDGDVLTWERTLFGRWIYRNLSQETGAPGLVSDITIYDHDSYLHTPGFTGVANMLAVAGKSQDGDLVLFTPMSEADDFGIYAWTVTNISADGLEPFGDATPVWTGRIQGYQTRWGGQNIVGLTAEGDLVVVWTAPGLSRWYTTNLSETAGTPAMTGSISVILTWWDGIHIHALDDQGAVHVTWWVPQFGGHWEHNNLTAETGGPLLDPSGETALNRSFMAFIGNTDTLNIVGFDADGRMRVYWWTPDTHEWRIGDITGSIGPGEAPTGFASYDQLGSTDRSGPYTPFGQSLYGYADDGSLRRVWWAYLGPDVWHVENLSEMSVPIQT
jgi:hypothetical protein